MTIHFYLNDENESEITSFHELKTNPFKVGQLIHLTVDEPTPRDYNWFNSEFKKSITKNNQNLIDDFNRVKISIVSEGIYTRFNVLNEPTLTFEYHCIIIN